jgi:3-oxoacyl-[acyl-carrier protein] reductase
LKLAGEGAHVVVNARSNQLEAETVAREARDLGVKAVPGSIDTRRDNPEWYQGHLPNAAGVPLGRQGSVDEIAATCLFLVSEDAGFITGQTIHVNGGAHYY